MDGLGDSIDAISDDTGDGYAETHDNRHDYEDDLDCAGALSGRLRDRLL